MQFSNGHEWFEDAGAMYGPPDLTDLAALFAESNRAPFAYLLDPLPNASSTTTSDLDRPPSSPNPTFPPSATVLSAYADALSYIGSIYLNLPANGGHDTPLATCRRIMAFPSCMTNTYFPALVCEERAPRALAMLAHVFAMMKLVESGVPWLKGVAGRQVGLICGMVLNSEKVEGAEGQGKAGGLERMVKWPMDVIEGRVEVKREGGGGGKGEEMER
jgi:hypothetical protein